MDQTPPQQQSHSQLFQNCIEHEPEAAPAATLGKSEASTGAIRLGGARVSRKKALMIGVGVIVLLAIIVIAVVWRKRYHSKPNCGKYSGDAKMQCESGAAACGSNGACLNALAHCMPIVDRVGRASGMDKLAALGQFKESELSLCASSIARVDPKFAATMGGAQQCLPAPISLVAQAIPEDMVMGKYNEAAIAVGGIANTMRAAKPLVPWGVRVVKAMPTCDASVAGLAGAGTPLAGLMQNVAGVAAPATP